jgi:hypothetical protein
MIKIDNAICALFEGKQFSSQGEAQLLAACLKVGAETGSYPVGKYVRMARLT